MSKYELRIGTLAARRQPDLRWEQKPHYHLDDLRVAGRRERTQEEIKRLLKLGYEWPDSHYEERE